MPKLLNADGDFEMVPIGRLKTHPRNVNSSDLGAIIESIKAHGFYGALVVQRGTCFVCAGNHRLLAGRELGYTALPVTWIDCDDETALRVMIADNRTTRLGNDDPAALAELLAELAGTETGLGPGLGYDGDDLDQLIADLAGMPQDAALPNTDPGDGRYKEQYGVIVICESEAAQEGVYNELSAAGHNCRVVVT